MAARGVPIGLGVDGSASNDSGHLLAEARQALLLQRALHGPLAFDPRQALHIATRGGAEVLGRSDCGVLEPGKRADLAVWDLSDIHSLGAWDKVAALILSPPPQVRDLFVEGRAVVRDGELAQTSRSAILRAADASLNRLKRLI
jgi:cytosine/adenosine deaminase-related metal-dependent hydrolase